MFARQLPARAGQEWLRQAYRLYRRNPSLLTAAAMAYLLAVFGVGFLPFVGPFLLSVIQPTLSVLLANACALVDSGQPPTREALLRHFPDRRRLLLALGGLQLAFSSVLLIVSMLLETLLGAPSELEAVTADNVYSIILPVLLVMVPLFMAFWFAPILAGWHGLAPLKAVFFSFVAVWRNLRAFAMYALSALLVAVIVPGTVLVLLTLVFPQGRDIFVSLLRFALLMTVGPMLMCGAYLSYRDIFASREATVETDA